MTLGDLERFKKMFLGPLEQSKPWDTNGIDGIMGFTACYFDIEPQQKQSQNFVSLHFLFEWDKNIKKYILFKKRLPSPRF